MWKISAAHAKKKNKNKQKNTFLSVRLLYDFRSTTQSLNPTLIKKKGNGSRKHHTWQLTAFFNT